MQQQHPKVQMNYPCRWQYTVIGRDFHAVQAAVRQHVTDYTLSQSRQSSGGKYLSVTVELTVGSEQERLALYRALTEDPAVHLVL
jgi:putative lipoic acid-binding regulatory protein